MYKLRSETIGIVNENGKPFAIAIPADAAVKVVGENQLDGTIDLIWNERRINVFAIDLLERGEPIDQTSN